MSKKTAVLLVMTLCLAFVGTFIACSKGSDGSSSSKAAPAAKAEAPEETAGFEEFPLGDDIELGPL
ncbi:MAG: hypothetical protein LBL00_07735, partial [Endomicrobium sp.]|nr:hypothetical protein [Endomicrobium sp.]